MKRFLEIGEIVSVFGIKGEVKVKPWCDSPDFLCEFDTLYYKNGGSVAVERARVAKNIVVMKIEGCDTVEDAQKLRGKILCMDRSDVELDEGVYFVQDLISMEARDGSVYGVITDVSKTGANDVYHIKSGSGKMLYAPAIPDVVKEVDVENGVMKIIPLDGLFDI